jgi:hypothetical protein
LVSQHKLLGGRRKSGDVVEPAFLNGSLLKEVWNRSPWRRRAYEEIIKNVIAYQRNLWPRDSG